MCSMTGDGLGSMKYADFLTCNNHKSGEVIVIVMRRDEFQISNVS